MACPLPYSLAQVSPSSFLIRSATVNYENGTGSGDSSPQGPEMMTLKALMPAPLVQMSSSLPCCMPPILQGESSQLGHLPRKLFLSHQAYTSSLQPFLQALAERFNGGGQLIPSHGSINVIEDSSHNFGLVTPPLPPQACSHPRMLILMRDRPQARTQVCSHPC